MTKATQTAGFDLSRFDTKARSEQGEEIQIIHPTDGATDIYIRVLGRDSEKVKAHIKRMNLRRNAGRTVNKNEEREGAEFLASITLGWRGIMKDGAPYEFNYDNAVEMYMNYDLVSTQVAAFVFDQVNFLKG